MALREVLSELIPDAKDIRLLVIESGIPLEYVTLTGSAASNWQSVLSTAEAQGKWPKLIVAILQRYPEHTVLWRALGERAGIEMPAATGADDAGESENEMPPESPARGGYYVTERDHITDIRRIEDKIDELERRAMQNIEIRTEARRTELIEAQRELNKAIMESRHELRKEFAPTVAAVEILKHAADRRLIAQGVIIGLVVLGGFALMLLVTGGRIVIGG